MVVSSSLETEEKEPKSFQETTWFPSVPKVLTMDNPDLSIKADELILQWVERQDDSNTTRKPNRIHVIQPSQARYKY